MDKDELAALKELQAERNAARNELRKACQVYLDGKTGPNTLLQLAQIEHELIMQIVMTYGYEHI
ncbi:MAG: hypothetical protein AAGK14_08735 [Verrucomicrobiota bacterium]